MYLVSYHYGYNSFNTPYLKVIIHMYKENIIYRAPILVTFTRNLKIP